MDLDVQQAEKRATRRFALRLPVSVNYAGDDSAALPANSLLIHPRSRKKGTPRDRVPRID